MSEIVEQFSPTPVGKVVGTPRQPLGGATQCKFDGCEKPTHSKVRQLCSGHNSQWMRGQELRPLKFTRMSGEERLKARYVNSYGYTMLYRPGHPNADKSGRICEHTVVMSEKLGRPLVKGENVHHINGDRADNRIENLELWSTTQPAGQRVADKVAWAKELLGLYEPGALA